mmetsp:Transcript_3698/g.9390  ORF Transcript_3698/g.9390 Transcript_3698/m.9390 type:complete len:298 (+) Transcript_3698:427-1320(+)
MLAGTRTWEATAISSSSSRRGGSTIMMRSSTLMPRWPARHTSRDITLSRGRGALASTPRIKARETMHWPRHIRVRPSIMTIKGSTSHSLSNRRTRADPSRAIRPSPSRDTRSSSSRPFRSHRIRNSSMRSMPPNQAQRDTRNSSNILNRLPATHLPPRQTLATIPRQVILNSRRGTFTLSSSSLNTRNSNIRRTSSSLSRLRSPPKASLCTSHCRNSPRTTTRVTTIKRQRPCTANSFSRPRRSSSSSSMPNSNRLPGTDRRSPVACHRPECFPRPHLRIEVEVRRCGAVLEEEDRT